MFAEHRRSTAISAFMLLISFCAPSAKAANLNYNNICLLITNGKLIASANSCSEYYSCQNGIATLQTCPSGMYFSKDSQQCLPASSVSCFGADAAPCSGQSIGSWAPVPNSCAGYYYCGANGAQRGNCPLGENFNPTAQACQYANQYPCGVVNTPGSADNVPGEVTGVNLCTFMPNGIFFGSASSCADYHLCTNNAMSTGTCPTGFVFNTQIEKCDYPQNVNCAQVTNDPNLTNSPSVGGSCTTIGTQKASGQCNSYYVCNGVNYQLYFCPNGLYYDTVSTQCVPRLNARNNCDRCLGSRLSFVNMASTTSCSGYLFCVNGVSTHSGYCPTGSYFNELSGACVIGAQPDFGCCNPAWPNGTPAITTEASTSTSAETTTKAPEAGTGAGTGTGTGTGAGTGAGTGTGTGTGAGTGAGTDTGAGTGAGTGTGTGTGAGTGAGTGTGTGAATGTDTGAGSATGTGTGTGAATGTDTGAATGTGTGTGTGGK